MGRSVGFLELIGHEKYLADMIRAADDAEYDITLYSTREIANEVAEAADSVEFSRTIQHSDEGLRRFLRRVSQSTARYIDVLVISTISFRLPDLFAYSRFEPSCPAVFWAHNVRNWLAPELSFRHGFRNNLRLYLQSRTASTFDHVMVESRRIADYVEAHIEHSHDVYPFVPVVHDGSVDQPDPEADELTLVVPGNINPERRDYESLLDALVPVFESGESVRLVLLGSPTTQPGEAIVNRSERLRRDLRANIELFDGWIPEAEFQQAIRAAHVVIAPLVRTSTTFPIEELYGNTKASGSVMDAIKHAKPLIIPEFYPIDDEVASSTLGYSSIDELEDAIRSLLSPDHLRELQNSSLENSQRFTLSKQANRFDELIRAVID